MINAGKRIKIQNPLFDPKVINHRAINMNVQVKRQDKHK